MSNRCASLDQPRKKDHRTPNISYSTFSPISMTCGTSHLLPPYLLPPATKSNSCANGSTILRHHSAATSRSSSARRQPSGSSPRSSAPTRSPRRRPARCPPRMNLVRMAPMNSSGAPPPALSSCEKLFTSSASSCCAGSRGTAAIPSAKPRWRPTPPSFWMDGSIYHILQERTRRAVETRRSSINRSGCSPSQEIGGEPAGSTSSPGVDPCATSGPTAYSGGNPREDGGGRRAPRWPRLGHAVGAESGRRDLPNEAASGEQGRDDGHGGVRCHHGAKERHGGERAVPGGDGEGGRADGTELGDGAGGGQGEEPDGAEDKGGQ
ncbi:hypothetical protein GQ55_9G276500 [Panicum hallii var. hallii]|uniref:Uncharacterized protein n=1 Tax=Panicum hallii var. hallii TaxID=1504633 RepID=A0A2T7C7H0_9POAL|nr:hypothetical protein GQ55_9G276500 [Panicum hallii var. hallii]